MRRHTARPLAVWTLWSIASSGCAERQGLASAGRAAERASDQPTIALGGAIFEDTDAGMESDAAEDALSSTVADDTRPDSGHRVLGAPVAPPGSPLDASSPVPFTRCSRSLSLTIPPSTSPSPPSYLCIPFGVRSQLRDGAKKLELRRCGLEVGSHLTVILLPRGAVEYASAPQPLPEAGFDISCIRRQLRRVHMSAFESNDKYPYLWELEVR